MCHAPFHGALASRVGLSMRIWRNVEASMMSRVRHRHDGLGRSLAVVLATAVWSMPMLSEGYASTAHPVCRLEGSTFVPKGYPSPKGYTYRLVIHVPPPSSDHVDFDSIWSFQAVGGIGGKVLAETRAGHYCPTGRGNCRIVAPHTPADENHVTDEIELGPDFGPNTSGAPQAIVISGFVDKGWAFSPEIPNRTDLLPPNLDDLVIWVRASCGDT